MINVSVIRTGSAIIVSDGKRTRESLCANPSAAKGLETRLKADKAAAAKWARGHDPEQLSLPLPEPARHEQLDLEDAQAPCRKTMTDLGEMA